MTNPLQEKTILCLATQEWNAHWTPVQQIALRLAPAYRVIYVEPFHPMFSRHRTPTQSSENKRRSRGPQLRQEAENLYIYTPSRMYVPFNMRSRISHWINSWLYRRELRQLMKSLGGSFLLWAFFAQSLSVLDLGFDHVIYDCVDDWPSFFPLPDEKAFVTRVDEALCRRADLVFVGSFPLREKKTKFNSRVHIVNHAADVEHFSKAADATGPIPPDLDAIRRPRLGFVGMIDRVRFDASLIGRLAEEYELQIALVGGAMPGSENILPESPNIHWLGMHSVAELPDYLRGMDVLLMPYAQNEATRTIYPLKLFEYLATGKPVVTTAIPAVDPLRQLMYVADSHEQFHDLVAEALAEKSPALAAARIKEAASHTWQAHLQEKLRLIESTFTSKAPVTPS
jgi:glycosyltransferase involved in cell wall biosynthesis